VSKTDIEEIKQIIGKTYELPTLPLITAQIMELTSNPETSTQDISEIISVDQALTTKVLRLVNSAYYGFPRQIGTITHALVILGFEEIRNLVFTTSVIHTFSSNENSETFNHKEFWEHSLGCALAAKTIAKALRYRISGKVFIAGLIHDIGKIILDQYMHNLFVQIVKKTQQDNISIYQAEKEIMGITHAEIGAELAKNWNLPKDIEEAINFHHTPKKATIDPQLTAIIHLSDILSRMKSVGYGGDNKIPTVCPSVWKTLKLLKSDLNKTYILYFASLFNDELKKAQNFFKIIDYQ